MWDFLWYVQSLRGYTRRAAKKKYIYFFLKSQCGHPVGGKKQAKMVSMLSKFKSGLCPSCPPLRIYYLSFYVQLSRNKKWIKTNRPDCVPII